MAEYHCGFAGERPDCCGNDGGIQERTKALADFTPNQTVDETSAAAYFQAALDDAARLLKYAAEMGIEVDHEMRTAILHARNCSPDGWTPEVTNKLLVALTGLAARLKPVTAASLKSYHSDTRPTMRKYLIWAIILSAVIIPASIATFVTSNISDAIRSDIVKANALTVKLNTELGPDGKVIVGASGQLSDLQEYASTVRSIYARATRLNQFVFPHVRIPAPLIATSEKDDLAEALQLKEKFELHVPLTDLPAARDDMTKTYQDVRFFSQTIVSDVVTFYGAINSCILPILYALLGTCAYLLRTFEDQMSTRTFIPSEANSARFLIAAIGGTVIGLFGGFTSQASAPPLAVAFLVGYAVEVFFAFLEGIIRSFTRSAPTTPAVQITQITGTVKP